MARKSQAAPQNSTQPAPARVASAKVPGFKITVMGQVSVKDDRKRLDLKRYEETFILPMSCKPRALGVVVLCLLPYRLAAKFENFAHVRTHEIKGQLEPVEDAGLGDLEKKSLWDMTAEEIRFYALLKDLKIPERNAQKQIVRVLDAVAIIKSTKVDFDLKEKVNKYLEKGAKVSAPVVEAPEAEESAEELAEETAGNLAPAAKAEWEKLDE